MRPAHLFIFALLGIWYAEDDRTAPSIRSPNALTCASSGDEAISTVEKPTDFVDISKVAKVIGLHFPKTK
jgi:hypothetical protein